MSLHDIVRFGAPKSVRPGVSAGRVARSVVALLLTAFGSAFAAVPMAAASPTAAATATPAAENSATPSPSVAPSADAADVPTAPADGSSTGTAVAKETATPAASASATPKAETSATPRASATAGSGSGPTIASDLSDYPPGGTVTLTGTGWQPGEVVTIVVNDTGGLSWSLTEKVVADAEGRIALTFDLPDYYVPNYDVTATGPVSGVAATTFTDADASGAWQYWMTAPTPANNGNVSPGGTITYTLNAQKTGTSSTAVTGAVMTLTLAGEATFTGPTGALGANLGSISGIGTSTLRWSGMTLNRTGTTNNTRTITVTATVPASASAGTVVATTGDDGDTNGGFYSGGSRLESTTHTVTGPVTNNCGFATPGSGAYASSICWFDLTGYDATTAASTNGQTMRQKLPGGYTLTYTVKASGTTVAASTLPTWSGAYLGNTSSGVGGYYGISGKPALYQTAGGTTTLKLSGITLTNSSGTQVSGFALVGADAESSDGGESITWTSSNTLVSIGTLGNACGGSSNAAVGSLVWSNGNKTALCNGRQDGATKTGTAILYSQDPTTFDQTMVGGGLQAVAFGVMVSGIQLKKAVVNPVAATDAFTITVTPSGQATALGSATANAASNWAADTGQLYWIASGSNQTFTMAETAVSPTNSANYAATWACTKNGASYTPTDVSSTSRSATLAFGEFIICTITNTGPALTLTKRVDNTTGGSLTPANWTLTAKSGGSTVLSEAPSHASSTSGGVTTASTATVAVPLGDYVLSESSTATGADRYAAGTWTCTNAGSGTFALNGSTLTLAAGNNVTCTITNTYRRAATIALWKTTTGAAGGPFPFVLTNTVQSGGSVTTGVAGTRTQVDGDTTTTGVQPFTAVAFGAAVTIDEPVSLMPAGWILAGASCSNGTGTVGTLTGTTYTIPAAEVVAGAVITCDYTNRRVVGAVTWSKVDAGNSASLLAGSEWTLTGPSYPAGTTVTDCVAASAAECTGLDQNPAAGAFTATNLLYGSYTLVEKSAPVGYQLDTTPHAFSIATDGQTVSVGAIADKRSVVPSLPLTGGASADAFLLSGTALLAVAGIGGWLHRRRLLRSL